MSWTEEKVNKLKELWGKDKTASQIAELIGGVSRNAVIGKAHRLNLSIKVRVKTNNQYRKKISRIITILNSKVDEKNLGLCCLIKILSQQKIYVLKS